MNLEETKYTQYSLVSEMMESVDLARKFNPNISADIIDDIKKKNKVFIAAEGSSRIFPAQNVIYNAHKQGAKVQIESEGAMQSIEYKLRDYHVFGVSNSGKTKEVVQLFNRLKNDPAVNFTGVACHRDVPLQTLARQFSYVNCGEEDAVAATKSVICQALYFDSLLAKLNYTELPDREHLANGLNEALTTLLSEQLVEKVASASKVYFAGRNNGVAEELALKTNEITRQQSDFLPGTFILHGIEEVVTKDDTIVLVNPYESELETIQKIYEKEIGANVVVISSEETPFDTIRIPAVDEVYKGYIALAAGWNLLVEAGMHRGVNLDKPERARKIGNEFTVAS